MGSKCRWFTVTIIIICQALNIILFLDILGYSRNPSSSEPYSSPKNVDSKNGKPSFLGITAKRPGPFISISSEDIDGEGGVSIKSGASEKEMIGEKGVHGFTQRKEETGNISVSTIPIGINKNSSLAFGNILSITHNPFESKIQVVLKKSGKCKMPFFLGRLSGPSLSIIKWEDTRSKIHQASNNANDNALDDELFVGHYQVPSLGKYFLEITMLLCNLTLLESAKTDVKDTNISCLEDPKQFRITSTDAHVTVTTPLKAYNQTTGFGSWNYQDESVGKFPAEIINVNSTAVDITENQQAAAGRLFTRYQPQGCRLDDKTNPICMKAMSMENFKPYRFQWNEKTEAAFDTLSSRVRENELICGVGWSHTRTFAKYFAVVAEQYNFSNQTFAWHKAAHLSDVNEKFITNLFEANCTKILFSLGQWDGLDGLSFADWRNQTSSIITQTASINNARKALEKPIAANTGDKYDTNNGNDSNIHHHERVGIYITANHYNPLGDVKLTCPVKDYRSPPITDIYNSISKEICTSSGRCTFVDTNSAVIGPMWDSAHDFCHYSYMEDTMNMPHPSPAEVEVSYILGVIFGLFDSV